MSHSDTLPGISTDPPRSTAQRKSDVLALLEEERHVWVSTAGPDGPHLVPLAYIWDGTWLVMATQSKNRTVRNLLHSPRARLALGAATDVVLLDGEIEIVEPGDAQARDLGAGLPLDPARGAGRVWLVFIPSRIMTWRHRGEIAGRTVMADSQWLA
ncbi:pyridoxamine 5'-phosphate oxidase family protein [Nonomuraea sp. CA-141351]|uniref:pyridoxamine 5'-phosphate oxidase family protein n=1 Tax=Nonomuraea sp. CA-141351 TaxID=3239996 RepID=UPI003D949EF5